MQQFVDAKTLQEWLADGRPVTVLDVRGPEDRAQWSIPGSVHVNAYAALKAGDPNALTGVDIPQDRPVVTVCNFGRVSQVAAKQLEERGGLEVFSLAGGMQSWSLAWNTAEKALTRATVVQVRRTGKGCLSYLVGSGFDAVVIDASVDPEVYLRLAAGRAWTIRYVLDTHVHADHLSRSRSLAKAAGATLLLPAQDRTSFAFAPLADGQTIDFGASRLTVMAAPGHTMESACYRLDGEALFTGDTLFVSGVGRPDLHASMEEARERARVLYRSLQRLLALSPETLVLPGHASEPPAFDRKLIGERLGTVSAGIASWLRSEDDFLAAILERIPPTPPNYLRIMELNEAGILPEDEAATLEAGANRCAVS
jgi:glyoxylase-like metal-dependent hydrolase (beta-lactamase superfamily II)